MPRSSHTRTYRGSFFFFWRTRIFLITFDHRHHRTHNNYIITLFRPARAATATLVTLIKILKPQNAGGKKHNEYTRRRSCKGSRGLSETMTRRCTRHFVNPRLFQPSTAAMYSRRRTSGSAIHFPTVYQHVVQ